MFEYDVQAPFDIEELSPPQEKSGVTIRDVAYASPRGGKGTATGRPWAACWPTSKCGSWRLC